MMLKKKSLDLGLFLISFTRSLDFGKITRSSEKSLALATLAGRLMKQ